MLYLSKSRHGTWRFRVVVPAHLRAAFPELPGDTSISLRSVPRRAYARTVRNMTLAWWQLQAALEASMAMPELTHYTLTDVIHPDGRRERTLTTSPDDTPEQLRSVLEFLERTGTPMPAPMRHLAQRLEDIRRRMVEARAATMSPVAAMAPNVVAANDATEPMRWLSDAVEAWRADQERVGAWTVAGTWRNTYEPALRAFRELISLAQRRPTPGAEPIWDIPLSQIDQSGIERYLEGVRRLPARQGQRPTGHDTKALLGLGLPPQSPISARGKIEHVRVFVQWACDRDLLPSELLKKFKQALRGAKADPNGGYRAFSNDELVRMFAPATFGNLKHAWQFWACRIALLTGARVREVADLTVDDIVHRDDIPCFWFRAGAVEEDHGPARRKRVKTVTSERQIPIATALLDLGLLEFVAARRKSKKVWLWDELIWEDKNGHARYVTEDFAERLRTLGIKTNRSKTFHSFRSTLLQAFDEVGLDSGIAERVVGHKGRSIRETHYMRGPDGLRALPLKLVREKLDAIEWGFLLQRDPRFCPPTATAAVTSVEGTQP